MIIPVDRVLSVAKAIAEIVDLGVRSYGVIEEKRLARENSARDERVKDLERRLAELEKRNAP
jgi:hypothetical protein